MVFADFHPREPGMRRDNSRPARRRAVKVAFSGAGFGYSTMVSSPVAESMVATVASVRSPRSIPAHTVGWVTVRGLVWVRSGSAGQSTSNFAAVTVHPDGTCSPGRPVASYLAASPS